MEEKKRTHNESITPAFKLLCAKEAKESNHDFLGVSLKYKTHAANVKRWYCEYVAFGEDAFVEKEKSGKFGPMKLSDRVQMLESRIYEVEKRLQKMGW